MNACSAWTTSEKCQPLTGQARGYYTFFGHLKWTPVIAIGYVASIYAHFLVNEARFSMGVG